MAYYLEPQANDLSKLNNGNTQDVLGDVNSSSNKTVPEGKGAFKLQSLSIYVGHTHLRLPPNTTNKNLSPFSLSKRHPIKAI